VERVVKIARKIAKSEKADLAIVEIAGLLHDISREKESKEKSQGSKKSKFCHAKNGALEAKKILKELKFSSSEIKKITHCIETHRSRNNLIPETKEAKVLFDADKIDALGAVGVARTFLFAGELGSKNLYTGNEKRLAKTGRDYSYTKEDSAILEYEIRLKKIKDKMMTKAGKKLAIERSSFMEQYFDRFWEEVAGKK